MNSDARTPPLEPPSDPATKPAEKPAEGPSGEPTGEQPAEPVVPPGSGRARELSRARTKPRAKAAETGRKHHLGAAPERMPVWRPDGTITTTRTSAAQLADQTDAQLSRLRADLGAEMTTAAAALDFEQAAHLRDEVTAVDAELDRRALDQDRPTD